MDTQRKEDEEYRKKIDKRRALLQKEEATASFLDGSTEDVEVRALTIREIDSTNFLGVLESEALFIELVCDKPDGWADGLTDESHDELIELATAVNRPKVLRRQMRGVALKRSIIEASTSMTSSSKPAER